MRLFINYTILFVSIVFVAGLPDSMIEKIRNSELANNKAKRSQTVVKENNPSPLYNNNKRLTASKRGLKEPNLDEENVNEWEQTRRSSLNNFDNISPSSLYNIENGDSNGDGFDDKTVAEYEKGFHYGINKDRLDEAIENAVLKSEIYGDPAAINQYRYYGGGGVVGDGIENRRKRRDLRKLRLSQRLKRDVELTPEEVLALLSLYESSRPSQQQQQQQYGDNMAHVYRFDKNFDQQFDDDSDETENWLNNPVLPHANSLGNDIGPNYYATPSKWGPFSDVDRPKRFMVSKRRSSNDPTKELRILNGPNRNDFYTLSQLLSNQREPTNNVPLYHRLVL